MNKEQKDSQEQFQIEFDNAVNNMRKVVSNYTDAPAKQAQEILDRLDDTGNVNEAASTARDMINAQQNIIAKLKFIVNLDIEYGS